MGLAARGRAARGSGSLGVAPAEQAARAVSWQRGMSPRVVLLIATPGHGDDSFGVLRETEAGSVEFPVVDVLRDRVWEDVARAREARLLAHGLVVVLRSVLRGDAEVPGALEVAAVWAWCSRTVSQARGGFFVECVVVASSPILQTAMGSQVLHHRADSPRERLGGAASTAGGVPVMWRGELFLSLRSLAARWQRDFGCLGKLRITAPRLADAMAA